MTEQEFIEAVEATGATGVEVRRADFDFGRRRGVALQLYRDGNRARRAVGMPVAVVNDRIAFDALLDWVKNPH